MSDPTLEIDLARKNLFWKFEHKLYLIFHCQYPHKESSAYSLTLFKNMPSIHKSVMFIRLYYKNGDNLGV